MSVPADGNSGGSPSYGSLERRFERLETNVHERLTYVERELQRLSVAVQTRNAGALSWPIIIAAIIVALMAGMGTYLIGVLR